ncbi:hypothetical protein EBU91_01440 [bacterium]|nr:hypothetical protein [bacterium]
MKFNVVTSMARFENFDKLKNHLSNFNIQWHIVIDDNLQFDQEVNENWISFYSCPNDKGEFYERCHYALNWFVENYVVEDETNFYCFLNDDDAYEEGFFNKLTDEILKMKESNSFSGLIICSMKRGDFTPRDVVDYRQHGTHTLIANKNNMVEGGVGLEQFIITGKLLKNHRMPLTVSGDGSLIVELVSRYNPIFIPDLFVLFNYYQPGRWIL